MQATTSTAPLFAATLRPDQPLPMAGGWVGLGLAGLLGAPIALAAPEMMVPAAAAFALAGASLILVGISMARRSRRIERITLWADEIEIVTEGSKQDRHMVRVPLAGIKLRLARDDDERVTGLFLRHPQGEIELGSFLSTQDRSGFAQALGGALRKARRAA